MIHIEAKFFTKKNHISVIFPEVPSGFEPLYELLQSSA